MTNRLILLALPLLALVLSAAQAEAQKVYRWVDKNGQVHYGDKVPPEYASQNRDVLNKSGIKVGTELAAGTPEAIKAREEAERAQAAAAEQARRDRMLLQTYQSPEEIELLRARRLDQIDAQLTIQEQSLANLKQRRAEQMRQASRYAPHSSKPDAPPLPEGLAGDLEQSASDIRVQEENLQKKREEREAVDRKFDEDLERFKELRKID
ncbi:MAG: DUF4124 domain-containing protein [Steroidobacteraceae bacterium]|jgi:hypothetical protein|nr:DUF4124 domain-containing protein [Steroidobacteraceae bacterium]